MNNMHETMDRFAIRELIDRYCNIINRRAWAEMPAVWAEDARWTVNDIPEFGPVTTFHGRDAVVAAVTGVVEMCSMLLHMTGACEVRVDGDTATATVSLQEVATFGDEGAGIYLLGIYYDEIVRTGEGWKFRSREFHPRFVTRQLPPAETFPILAPAGFGGG